MKKVFIFVFMFFSYCFAAAQEDYSINFENIPIKEYINFVKKVCDTNFIFEEKDLNFTVTVMCKEKTNKENIMETLVQILRIHGFSILEEKNNLIIHKNSNIKQIAKIDENGKENMPPIITKIFKIKNADLFSVSKIIKPMISQDAIFEIFEENRQVIITDIQSSMQSIEKIIEAIDGPEMALEIESYKVKENPTKYLIDLTNKIMKPLIEKATFILVGQEKTEKIFIISTPKLIEKAISILMNIDTAQEEEILSYKTSFFTYQPKNRTLKDLFYAAQDLEKNLENTIGDKDFIQTLKSAKIVQSTHSLLFTGNENSFAKVKQILISLDTKNSSSLTSIGEKTFFIYKIQNAPYKKIFSALKNTSNNFKEENVPEKNLIETIDSAKYIPDTNSILFTGNKTSLLKVEKLVKSFDVDIKTIKTEEKFFIYKPKNRSISYIENSLKEVEKKLLDSPISDPSFIKSIKNVQKIDNNKALLFTGDDKTISKIQDLLTTLDTESEKYFLYKLKYASGNLIEEDLDKFSDNLKTQKIKNPDLIKVLENSKWIKETNSIMLTGNIKAIEEAKEIIQEFDVQGRKKISLNDHFLIYHPKYASADYIKATLLEMAENLQKANLADQDLLHTIENVKIIFTTKSLVFTGTQNSIDKISKLLVNIDTKDAERDRIKKIGEKTYLIYKIKKANPQKLISSIKEIARDLEKTKASDHDFIKTINSVQYKKENNSLFFTGNVSSLEKVKAIVEKFDIESPIEGVQEPSNYFVYQPKYLSGPDLKNVLINFTKHLKITGLKNENLFYSIQNMKWDESTKSLIVSGDSKSLEEIKKLFATFDVPKKFDTIKDIIQPIDETSFLVYKLQYHKGDEIQSALKEIAKELTASKANVKKNLINAINSMQWMQITNSLLCSGDNNTMQRLKELISNLDVPLKQVFIEMLVLETSFTNLLNFGLDWGGKYQNENRFVTGLSNAQSPRNNGLDNFMQNLDNLSTKNPVQGKSLPFGSGFDLGIIGDVIMHKGASFLSLGSFLQAIQADEETSIVSTPKLIAQDNKNSTIFFGQNIPYIGSQTKIQGASSSETSNLEYRDIGMSLSITPVLGNSDTVTLNLNLQRTVASPEQVQQSLTGVQGIITSKTSMQTTVHIPNKNFLVLSGMITETKSKSKSGIPCLGGLPLIGSAFSSNNRADDKKNIVIFIKPHIINSYEDLLNITQSQEDFFRENSGSPILEKDFDESMEFIKSYE